MDKLKTSGIYVFSIQILVFLEHWWGENDKNSLFGKWIQGKSPQTITL